MKKEDVEKMEAAQKELDAWMKANVELRHKVRDENLHLLAAENLVALFTGPAGLSGALKCVLYAGYITGLRDAAPKAEVPNAFKKAFDEENGNK